MSVLLARHLEPRLLQSVEQFPVVTLTGPRQSGKTTLARTSLPNHEYVSLEDPDQRRIAREDPRGFLDRFRGPVVIDEAQHAPDLFSYIQGVVDRTQSPGQFVLTGSQNFLLARRISQSLAGRSAVLHLLPLSRPELAGEPLRPIEEAGDREPGKGSSGTPGLFPLLFSGGYPRVHAGKLDPQAWLSSYYQTYIQRDVRELLNVGDLESFGRFLGLCAGRSGQLLNLTGLANDCGTTHTTARRWLSVLEASFVVVLLQPHHRNFNKRLVKAPKLYFLDSGLLVYLLRIRSFEDLKVHASRGAVFESWVVSEAVKNFVHRGLRPDLYFWRDSTGHEIDLVIEAGAGRLVPVEAKSGQTFTSDFVRDLTWWRRIAGLNDMTGCVVYGGDESLRYKEDRVLSWRDWG